MGRGKGREPDTQVPASALLGWGWAVIRLRGHVVACCVRAEALILYLRDAVVRRCHESAGRGESITERFVPLTFEPFYMTKRMKVLRDNLETVMALAVEWNAGEMWLPTKCKKFEASLAAAESALKASAERVMWVKWGAIDDEAKSYYNADRSAGPVLDANAAVAKEGDYGPA
jgi:hypothetical protein